VDHEHRPGCLCLPGPGDHLAPEAADALGDACERGLALWRTIGDRLTEALAEQSE